MAEHNDIRSAEVVAMLRAVACKEAGATFAEGDRLARLFLRTPSRILVDAMPQALLRALIERRSPGSYGFAIARTAYFDAALQDAVIGGAQQVVVLGAGYDSRALRFAQQLSETAVFEADHPATQERKRAILRRAGLTLPATHRFVPVDLNSDCLAAALSAAGFKSSKRTALLWEGVSYYLPPAAIARILAFAGGLAIGSTLTFDYAIKRFVEGDASTHGGPEVARWLECIGEPFRFGMEPEEAPLRLGEHGLDVLHDLSPRQIETRYLGAGRRTLGHVRFLQAVTNGRDAAAAVAPARHSEDVS